MKWILALFVIFLTPPVFADSATEFYPALGEFIPKTEGDTDPSGCPAPDALDFSKTDHPFHRTVELATDLDPALKQFQFESTDEAELLRKKLGSEFNAAIHGALEVLKSEPNVGSVKALSTFRAVSHLNVPSAEIFIRFFQKYLTAPEASGVGE